MPQMRSFLVIGGIKHGLQRVLERVYGMDVRDNWVDTHYVGD